MVTEVVVRIPNVTSGREKKFVNRAAKKLSTMTVSGNVEFEETTTFKPADKEGNGANDWDTYRIEATCPDGEFDEEVVRDAHRVLVQNIDIPEDAAVETVTSGKEELHIVG